jgi:hypothetical protein
MVKPTNQWAKLQLMSTIFAVIAVCHIFPDFFHDFLMIPLVFSMNSGKFHWLPKHAWFVPSKSVCSFCSYKLQQPTKKTCKHTGDLIMMIMHPQKKTQARASTSPKSVLWFGVQHISQNGWLMMQNPKTNTWFGVPLWLRTPSYNIPSGNQTWQWNMILYNWMFRSRKSSNYCGFPIAMMTTEGTFNQGNIKTVNFTPINCQFNFHTNTITQLSKC